MSRPVPCPRSALDPLVHQLASAVCSTEPPSLVLRSGEELVRDVAVLDQLVKELRAAVVLGRAKLAFEKLAAENGTSEEVVNRGLHSL